MTSFEAAIAVRRIFQNATGSEAWRRVRSNVCEQSRYRGPCCVNAPWDTRSLVMCRVLCVNWSGWRESKTNQWMQIAIARMKKLAIP